MALTQQLDFEEGTNGANLVAAGPYLAVSGPPTYESIGAPYGLVMSCTNGDYATVATASVDNGAFSVLFEILAITTGVPRIITFTDGANTFIGMFRAHTDGKFDIANGASTRVSASTSSWAPGIYRVDGFLGGSGTARTVTLKVFAGDTNTSPVWDTGGAVAITSSTAGAWARSRPGAQGNTNGTVRILHVRHYDTQIFAGPLTTTVSGVLAATLPAPAASMEGHRSIPGTATVTLPAPTATMTGLRQGHGSGAAALPAPAATLVGKRTVVGLAGVTLPAPTATATGKRTVLAVAGVTLAAPVATLTGLGEGHGSGAALLPAPSATLIGKRTVFGALVVLLPAPVGVLVGAGPTVDYTAPVVWQAGTRPGATVNGRRPLYDLTARSTPYTATTRES